MKKTINIEDIISYGYSIGAANQIMLCDNDLQNKFMTLPAQTITASDVSNMRTLFSNIDESQKETVINYWDLKYIKRVSNNIDVSRVNDKNFIGISYCVMNDFYDDRIYTTNRVGIQNYNLMRGLKYGFDVNRLNLTNKDKENRLVDYASLEEYDLTVLYDKPEYIIDVAIHCLEFHPSLFNKYKDSISDERMTLEKIHLIRLYDSMKLPMQDLLEMEESKAKILMEQVESGNKITKYLDKNYDTQLVNHLIHLEQRKVDENTVDATINIENSIKGNSRLRNTVFFLLLKYKNEPNSIEFVKEFVNLVKNESDEYIKALSDIFNADDEITINDIKYILKQNFYLEQLQAIAEIKDNLCPIDYDELNAKISAGLMLEYSGLKYTNTKEKLQEIIDKYSDICNREPGMLQAISYLYDKNIDINELKDDNIYGFMDNIYNAFIDGSNEDLEGIVRLSNNFIDIQFSVDNMQHKTLQENIDYLKQYNSQADCKISYADAVNYTLEDLKILYPIEEKTKGEER